MTKQIAHIIDSESTIISNAVFDIFLEKKYWGRIDNPAQTKIMQLNINIFNVMTFPINSSMILTIPVISIIISNFRVD